MSSRNIPVVFFDLETTGLLSKRYLPDIISIGAVDSIDKDITYDKIYHPFKDIKIGASRVNGFTMEVHPRSFGYDEYLCLNGKRVNGMDMKEGLESFLDWIDAEYGVPVLLVSHNCFRFDAEVLLQNFYDYGVKWSRVTRAILGFSDSLLACREFYIPPYSLSEMLKGVGVDKNRCQSHDALEDAQDVRTLVRRMAKQNHFTFREFVRDKRWCKSLLSMEKDCGLERVDYTNCITGMCNLD